MNNSGAQFTGFLLIALGLWLIDCALKNRKPFTTLFEYAADPTLAKLKTQAAPTTNSGSAFAPAGGSAGGGSSVGGAAGGWQ